MQSDIVRTPQQVPRVFPWRISFSIRFGQQYWSRFSWFFPLLFAPFLLVFPLHRFITIYIYRMLLIRLLSLEEVSSFYYFFEKFWKKYIFAWCAVFFDPRQWDAAGFGWYHLFLGSLFEINTQHTLYLWSLSCFYLTQHGRTNSFTG